MNTNRRIQFIVFLMLIGLTVATITNVTLNFRQYGYDNSIEKATMTAEVVRNGLISHMLNDTMDKRGLFLSDLAHLKDIHSLRVVRSNAVVAQFGEGLQEEGPKDAIDRQVLREGKTISQTFETSRDAMLRVTIPYIATTNQHPKCLSCHHAKEGDVLGAISIELNVNSVRQTGAIAIAKILGINLIFIVIALWVTGHYFKPYMQIFENLQQGIKRARTGDFSFRFTTTLKGEGSDVADQMNTLFEKIDDTFGHIQHDLGTFISSNYISCSDPLNTTGNIIRELSDVYKFKKTIELDCTKHDIYDRFVYVLKEKFHFNHFALYEVDKNSKIRKLIYITDAQSFCYPEVDTDASLCRAYRTLCDVYSTDFNDVCKNCSAHGKQYTCVPFNINDDLTLTLSYSAKDVETIEQLNQSLHGIKSYFEAAKAVIESHTLTDKLRESSLRDGATKLYNRRFLEEFIEHTNHQAARTKIRYSILMIDIDFFKMVNDTYGHDAGDIVILNLAQILQTSVRNSDLPIRYGGEEFLVLLHNSTSEGALEVAQKIRTSFAQKKFNFGNNTVEKTLSIGVSHFPSDADSIWKVIKFADLALYEAKHGGRNKVVEFKPEMFNGGDNF